MAKRVLTVDDSSTMRQLVLMTLEPAGYEVAMAEDGAQALKQAGRDTFDVILTDINMPVMNGIELVRELRKLPHCKFTPILMVTTESEPEKKQEGKAAGATGWIVKPFEPDKLVATVAKVLR